MNRATPFSKIVIPILFLLLPFRSPGQDGRLDHRISLRVRQKPLAQTLLEIGHLGDFYFSYNSNILKGDSLVSLDADNKTIRQILGILLGDNYEYSESGRYIVLQSKITAPPARNYTISGWVVDADTKRKISRASIYEAGQLVSTLTDSNGYFKLRLKDRPGPASITISKELYRDSSLSVREGRDQEYTLMIRTARFTELSPFVVSSRVEKTWLGRLFLSSRQKIQSLNVLDFFADKPIQFSLTPGLGTHGQMGAQVINKFSLNILGGYTAGSNGLELAGLFNIDKKDVNYVQAAGLFNIVGGNATGMQLAGLHDHVLGKAHGLQAAGLSNIVGGNYTGFQLAGLYNNDQDSMQGLQAGGLVNQVRHAMFGMQIAGLVNVVAERSNGVQVAGLGNISNRELNGLQLGPLFNYTKNLKGVQIGLVNIADTSSGCMIGLINITKHGYHSLSLSASETLPLTLSYKSGGRKIYSILLAGMDPRNGEKAFMFGYGIGTNGPLSSKWSLTTDLTEQEFYIGNRTGMPVIYRLQSSLLWQWTRKISFFAGPALSLYDPGHALPADGYKVPVPAAPYHTFSIGNTTAWFGWSAGINFL